MENGKKKIRVGIIFGGKSAEHEVSLRSAKNVFDAMDTERYEPVLIGIDKQGRWMLQDNAHFLLNAGDPKTIQLNTEASEEVALAPESRGAMIDLKTGAPEGSIDVVFPILHGPFGEDGTMQGLLKLANIPFVGPGVLGSAVGMDKDVMKRLLRDAGIPVAKFIAVTETSVPSYNDVVRTLGSPVFVKPANLGSSVGVSKATNEAEFASAVADAFAYDRKILIEEYIEGREIECAVLGNETPRASVPGEIIAHHDFYSYEAKYLDEDGAAIAIPAQIPEETAKRVRALAVQTFLTLSCEGLGRVDFFLKGNGDILVNEINTMPGFTSISMYPKLWEATGISYTEIISRLFVLAVELFEKERKLKTSR